MARTSSYTQPESAPVIAGSGLLLRTGAHYAFAAVLFNIEVCLSFGTWTNLPFLFGYT